MQFNGWAFFRGTRQRRGRGTGAGVTPSIGEPQNVAHVEGLTVEFTFGRFVHPDG